MIEIGLAVTFAAGIVSFLSPCVLPLIPGFLGYLAGIRPGEGMGGRKAVFLASVFFVFGFSAVFAVLGVLLNTLLEAVAYDVQAWLSRIGGAVIIFFGLYLMGLIKIPFLEREHKFAVKSTFRSHHLTSFAFGAAFAAGWTPCVGAALGAALGLATSNPEAAFYLLLAYSLGLGLPFLLVGLFASQASALINKYARTLHVVNIVFGATLVAIGVLVFTQQLSRVANLEILNRWLLQ